MGFNLSFGDALEAVKQGAKVSRDGWNGKYQYAEMANCISYQNNAGELVFPDHDKTGNKCLAFVGTSGVQLGWLPTQSDMLAEDWFVLP